MIDDGMDLLISALATVLLLTICIWTLGSVRNSSETAIDERIALDSIYVDAATQPEQTVQDFLMCLVVGDEYMPTPKSFTFIDGDSGTSYSIVVDENFLADRVGRIHAAWENFFNGKMNKKILSVTLNDSGTSWNVLLKGVST